jgi:mannose-1-phosphate guanylyltransferase
MKDVLGVVLCGGLGSRLRPLTYYFQKTMLPVGTAQRPILEYILATLRESGVQRALLLANYKFEQIQNYFGDGSKVGMKLSYVMDNPKMTGSGGALLNALEVEDVSERTTLLIYYGDILTRLRIGQMLGQHSSHGATATLAVANEFRLPVGVAKMRGHRISSFAEKPSIRVNVGVGIMALEAQATRVLREMNETKSNLDIMGDLLPELIRRKYKVEGFLFREFWLDVGSIEAYEKIDNRRLDEAFADMQRTEVRAS